MRRPSGNVTELFNIRSLRWSWCRRRCWRWDAASAIKATRPRLIYCTPIQHFLCKSESLVLWNPSRVWDHSSHSIKHHKSNTCSLIVCHEHVQGRYTVTPHWHLCWYCHGMEQALAWICSLFQIYHCHLNSFFFFKENLSQLCLIATLIAVFLCVPDRCLFSRSQHRRGFHVFISYITNTKLKQTQNKHLGTLWPPQPSSVLNISWVFIIRSFYKAYSTA